MGKKYLSWITIKKNKNKTYKYELIKSIYKSYLHIKNYILVLLLYNSSGHISAPLAHSIDKPDIFTELNFLLFFNSSKSLNLKYGFTLKILFSLLSNKISNL